MLGESVEIIEWIGGAAEGLGLVFVGEDNIDKFIEEFIE